MEENFDEQKGSIKPLMDLNLNLDPRNFDIETSLKDDSNGFALHNRVDNEIDEVSFKEHRQQESELHGMDEDDNSYHSCNEASFTDNSDGSVLPNRDNCETGEKCSKEHHRHESQSGDDEKSYDSGSMSEDDDMSDDLEEFERTYISHPVSMIGKSHLELGDQIIMPQSAFEQLLDMDVEYPMLFEVQNESKDRVSHCGVSEFTADEGSVLLPNWMMENLRLQEGDHVSLKYTSLERGTYIKLQPHSKDFLGITNPKAALEQALSANFFCLTSGDTIKINHNNKSFQINVVETKPSAAICIIDTDCEVDFAAPLDYVEPAISAKPELDTKKAQKFMPFTGLARRLDEKSSPQLPAEEANNMVIDGASRVVTQPGVGSPRNLQNVVLGSQEYKGSKRNEFNEKDDMAGSPPKKKEFQPFTGKKYSLLG